MPSRKDCKRFNRAIHAINPNRQGLALNYFSPTCPDPATALSYWRRRFRSADRYLANYWYPRTWGKRVSKGYLQTRNFVVYDNDIRNH